MKNKTTIFLTAMTVITVLTGCGSSAKTTDNTPALEQETVVTAAETEAPDQTDSSLTLEEAVANTSGVQAQLDQVKEAMGIEIEVSGNTMTYKFPLDMEVSEDDKELVAEQLEAGFEEQSDSFLSMKEGLEEESGVSDIILKLVYVDSNGNEIFSKTID